MTPHNKRAARLRQQALDRAIEILKVNPRFAAAQVRAYDRGAELAKNLSPQQPGYFIPARMDFVLKILNIQAEAYLSLVDDMKSQEAFMTLLEEFGHTAFANFTGFPLEAVVSIRGNELEIIQQKVSHWVNEGYKRLIPCSPEAIEQPALRRGHRAEVRAWMAARGIKTVAQAAKDLAVSETTLKNIMSDKGKVRYGRDTLEQILEKIRPIR